MKKLIKSGPGAGYDVTVKGIELERGNFKILKDEVDERYGLHDVTVEVAVKPCVAEYWSAEDYYYGIDSNYVLFDSSEDSKIEGGKAVLFFTGVDVDEGVTLEDAVDGLMPSELNLTMMYGGGWSHMNLPEDGIHFDDDNGRHNLDIGEVYDYETISCDLLCPNICQDINAFFENPEEYYDDYVTNSRKAIKSDLDSDVAFQTFKKNLYEKYNPKEDRYDSPAVRFAKDEIFPIVDKICGLFSCEDLRRFNKREILNVLRALSEHGECEFEYDLFPNKSFLDVDDEEKFKHLLHEFISKFENDEWSYMFDDKEIVENNLSKLKFYLWFDNLESDVETVYFIYSQFKFAEEAIEQFLKFWNMEKYGSLVNSRKAIKSANDYGWEVDSSEVPEALDLFVEYVGKETALEEIARAMGTDVLEENLDWVIRQWGFAEDVEDMDDVWEKFEHAKEVMGADELYENLTQAAGHDELAEDLAFIFRQYDFREWDERKGNIDSGCHGKGKGKKKGKKEIKSAMDSRSLGDFSDDIIVRVLEVESYDDRSPSVYDFFSEGDEMDLAEFKRSCKDLAEGQNGYFQVDDSSNQYQQIVNFTSYDDEETMTGSVTFEVVLGLRNDALDDYLVASLKKEIKSMARQYMKPQYDARKSFYNKAETDDDKLYSYGTLVAEIVDGEPVLHDKWDYSATTIRHVKEWLQQNGFEAGTKQEIGRKYKKAEN